MAGWVAVNAGNIAARWRPLTAAEAVIAPTLIEDAQDELEEALEEIGITAAPSPTDQRWERKYVRTVAAMVRRVLSNPEGYLQETIDGYEYRRDKAISTGSLYLADDELDRFRSRPRRRAYTVVPG